MTLSDDRLVNLDKEWQCIEQESFSDHRIITFQIQAHRGPTRKYIHHGIKYVTSEEAYKNFETHFIAAIRQNFALAGPGSLDDDLCTTIAIDKDIELTTEKYQGSVAAACRKSFRVRKGGEKTIVHKSAPWWTTEFTIMWKKMNAMRRRYQHTISNENLREDWKQLYQQEKKKYAAALRKTKTSSWKQYCNPTTTSNPWNAVNKLASGNLKQSSTLSTLRMPAVTDTKDGSGRNDKLYDRDLHTQR